MSSRWLGGVENQTGMRQRMREKGDSVLQRLEYGREKMLRKQSDDFQAKE